MQQTKSTVKPRVFSGVQPTGKLHIGNYSGAISVWAQNQDFYDNIFCVVDLHAITLPDAITPAVLRQKSLEVAALYIACGIDPEKSTIFIQSHVPQHAELAWILNCVTPLGWLYRMTQFKSKSNRNDSIGTGLLDYPVLMAADILLYDTDSVPVGEDQKQHIEITRDIAQRFNSLYKFNFKIPSPFIRASGARIMGLDNPEDKMSKSIGEQIPGHSIGLLDSPNEIKKAIMRATTDSESEVRFDYAKPGVLNLLTIYEVLTGKARTDIENEFSGKGYGNLKKKLVEVVVESLKPVRQRYDHLMNDKSYIDSVLATGAHKASAIAEPMIHKVKEAVGFIPVR